MDLRLEIDSDDHSHRYIGSEGPAGPRRSEYSAGGRAQVAIKYATRAARVQWLGAWLSRRSRRPRTGLFC
jgi:hypothetical protein